MDASDMVDSDQPKDTCIRCRRPSHKRTRSVGFCINETNQLFRPCLFTGDSKPLIEYDDQALRRLSEDEHAKMGSFSHRRAASYGGPGEDLLTNASRVVEQAEELMIKLWERVGWNVVHYTHLPAWMRDNDYLHWGHRPQLPSFRECFGSIFSIHTETGNIWTHLIGCIGFLLLCISFLVHPGLELPWEEKFAITIFFVSAILALGFSWTFHTVSCHSEHVGRMFNKLDYMGIALLVIGSFVPWIHYSFYCHVPSKIAYLSLIICLGTISMFVSSQDRFCTPEYRGIRAALFIGLGLSAVVPFAHYIFLRGFWEAFSTASAGWLVLMAFLYISGALIYAFRIPESLYPGKFDIWFQSHQIFHVFVVLAALVHWYSILEIAAFRHSERDCNVSP